MDGGGRGKWTDQEIETFDQGDRPTEDHDNRPTEHDNRSNEDIMDGSFDQSEEYIHNQHDQNIDDEPSIQGGDGSENNVPGGGESKVVDQGVGLHGEHQNLGDLSSEDDNRPTEHDNRSNEDIMDGSFDQSEDNIHNQHDQNIDDEPSIQGGDGSENNVSGGGESKAVDQGVGLKNLGDLSSEHDNRPKIEDERGSTEDDSGSAIEGDSRPTIEGSTGRPTGGVSTEVTTEEPTEVPTEGPTEGGSTGIPTEGPTEGGSSGVSTDGPTEGPTGDGSTEVPTGGPTEGPTGGGMTEIQPEGTTEGLTEEPTEEGGLTEGPTGGPKEGSAEDDFNRQRPPVEEGFRRHLDFNWDQEGSTRGSEETDADNSQGSGEVAEDSGRPRPVDNATAIAKELDGFHEQGWGWENHTSYEEPGGSEYDHEEEEYKEEDEDGDEEDSDYGDYYNGSYDQGLAKSLSLLIFWLLRC